MVSLLHAGLLPWIAAVLIPVAIHLLTRRSRQRTELPTTRFVRQTLAHQSRLFRWRHLLLLLLRVLAVLALSLAFTRPHLNSRLTHPTQDRVGLVLLLDVSESMAFTSGGLSTLARAKTSALQAIAGLRSGDRANLVLCAAQPQPVFTEPIPDLAAVQNAVRQARPTVERADPAAALSMALDQLEKSNAQVRRLYLLSDFQRTNWAEVRLEGIPPAVQVVYINADSGVRENTGLTALRIRPPLPRAGEPVQVECEVFHSGPGARELPVTLSLSNGAQFTERVRLAPYSSAAARFRLRFDTPQRLECTAAVPSDALPADNVRHAVLDLRRLPVVTLVTDEDVDRPPSAAFFLGHALRPNPRTTNGFEVRAVASHQLGNPQLQVADAALVCGAPGLTPVQIEGLSRYVQDGGTLVWLLYGEEIAGQLAALGRALPAAEPLPFQVEEVTDLAGNGKGFVSLTEARYESPLLRAFKDPAAADLSRARVRRLCLTTEVDPRAELLLQYEDGTAAAVRAAEGRGNLLLLNLVPAPGWSDLARQEAFLPLFHEMLKGLLARDTGDREFYPGLSVSATLPAFPAGAAPTVTCTGPQSPGEPAQALKVSTDPTTGSVLVDGVRRAGFYRILVRGRAAASVPVSPHPDESDLRPLDPRELESRRMQGASVLVSGTGNRADLEALQRGTPLWHWLFLLALLALFGEQALARLRPRVRR